MPDVDPRESCPSPILHPPAVPSPASESRIPFEGKRKSMRASERARGGSPIRLSRLHFEPQLEPRHIQFLTGDRSDASVVPDRARRRILPSGFRNFHPSPQRIGGSGWDNRDTATSRSRGVSCEIHTRGALYTRDRGCRARLAFARSHRSSQSKRFSDACVGLVR